MTKWICAFTLAGLLWFSPALAAETEKSEPKSEKVFLWEVRSDTATVYLLGSLHLLKKAMYPLDHSINKAYEKSDTLVVEVNMVDMKEEQIGKLMQEYGVYKGEETLEKNLSRETLKKLNEYLEKQSMSLDQVNKMRPWYFNLTIIDLESTKLGYDAQSGIDMYFLKKAQAIKTILELETMEEQIEMMAGDPKEVQDISLRSTLKELPNTQQLYDIISEAWMKGDADSISQIMRKSEDKYPELKPQIKKMIDERNISMANKIKEYLKTDKTYFVVVGAMHIGGKQGILNLLQNDAYRIAQVDKSRESATLKASTNEIPAILKSIDYDYFFPDGLKAWRLIWNFTKKETVSLVWINDEQHELELNFRKATPNTIQAIYRQLGKEIDYSIKIKGGEILVANEFFAQALIKENPYLLSLNLLYGTPDGTYLWKYKIPPTLDTKLKEFIEKLTFIARKEQYEKALSFGNVTMGGWQDSVHEYARLLAKRESPDTEAVYLGLLRTAPNNYEAHIEFTSITKDRAKILESAKIVRKNAEEAKLLEAAARILNENHPDLESYPLVTPEDSGLKVILIPLPPFNPWILREVAETFESITTIPVSIRRLPVQWDLPPPTRSKLRRRLERAAANVWGNEKDFSNWSEDKLKDELLNEAKKEGPNAVLVLENFFKKMEKEEGQWDAALLLNKFQKALVPYKTDDSLTMYVGITERDIYSEETNYVFSLYSTEENLPASILSFARMKAESNGEKQSRKRLVERTAKEVVPASLKRLNIPRSIDPACPYSYANGIQRLDEKTLKLSEPVMAQIKRIKHTQSGYRYWKKKDYGKTIEEYSRAISIVPDYANTYLLRGLVYDAQGEFGKAIKDYDRAIALEPENENVYLNRGVAYYKSKEYAEAIKDFIKAAALKPDKLSAHNNLARAYIGLKDYEGAVGSFSKAIDIKPDIAGTYYERGMAYVKSSRMEQAIEDWNKVLSIDPTHSLAFNNLGRAYYEKGENEKALPYFTEAINLNLKFSLAFENRGLVYLHLKDKESAISDFQEACHLGNKSGCRLLERILYK